MPKCQHLLPGFKASCLTVCAVYTALAGGLLLRGVRPSMAEFAVPPAVLDSPHYIDAITWVYTHMLVIGWITGVVGAFAAPGPLQVWFARLMFAAHVMYTVLDARASDSPLGDALYRGPGSIAPVIVCLVVTVLFAHLSVCEATRGGAP